MDYISRNILGPKETTYLNGMACRLKDLMKPSLFSHSLGTIEFSLTLAKSCPAEADIPMLATASLVHDYGRVFSYEELKEIAVSNGLGLSEFELDLKPVLHSLVGGYLISRDLGIKDDMIKRAVSIHTIGAVDMTLEEKILFVSDKIEENRAYNGVERLRRMALDDINLCLIEVYKNTIMYVVGKNGLLHPDTSGIWNSICGGN